MPRLNPAKGMVMSADIGGGKAIIEIKNPKCTITLELAEDSPRVSAFPEGAIVTYTFEVELPRESVQLATGPQPGDEIKTSKGIVIIPQPEEAAAVAASAKDDFADLPEKIRAANPIVGYNTVGIDGTTAGGESMRDLLGIPTRERQDNVKAGASPSSNG